MSSCSYWPQLASKKELPHWLHCYRLWLESPLKVFCNQTPLDLLPCNSWLVHQCRLDLRAPPSCVSDMTLPSCYANNGPTADTSQSFPLPGAGPNDISSYTSLSCTPWGQHTFITSEVERQTARAQGCGCTGGTPSVWLNTLKYSLLYN